MGLLTSGTHGLSISHAGYERRYLVHVPPGHSAKPQAAVVFLHGAGATARWSLSETRLAAAADRHGFLVVAPEAIPLDPSQPPKFLMNPQVWSAGGRTRFVHQRDPDDLGFLHAVLDDLPRHVVFDPHRLYVTGFSNGAAMTFRMGAALGDRIAAIAPVAGNCPVPLPKPKRPMPTLFLIGDSDPLIPYRGGHVKSPWTGDVDIRPPVRDTLLGWMRAIGCESTLVVTRHSGGVRVEEYAAGPRGATLILVTIAGLGHHWPGGRGQLKHSIAGMPSNRINANDVIWEFFRGRA